MLDLSHFVPTDKSLLQRALLFCLLTNKPCEIKARLGGGDVRAAKAFVSLFADIKEEKNKLLIKNQSFLAFNAPLPKRRIFARKHKRSLNPHAKKGKSLTQTHFNCQNSGTLMRLATGLLCGLEYDFVLSGDESLSKRPMKRITLPLSRLNACIKGSFAPLLIKGKRLNHAKFFTPLSSAQLKSAFILAALFGRKKSYFKEGFLSRDHTESMLLSMGCDLKLGKWLQISPLKAPLRPLNITCASDPSQAFFLILLGIFYKSVLVRGVLMNKTRLEGYKVLLSMGAKLQIIPTKAGLCDIYAHPSSLSAVSVSQNIPWLIDELPALAIAFSLAKGISTVANAAELRIKESDRISTMCEGLRECGVDAKESADGFFIKGGKISKALVKTACDHRVAMSFMLLAPFGVRVDDTSCVDSSFEGFKEALGAVFG